MRPQDERGRRRDTGTVRRILHPQAPSRPSGARVAPARIVLKRRHRWRTARLCDFHDNHGRRPGPAVQVPGLDPAPVAQPRPRPRRRRVAPGPARLTYLACPGPRRPPPSYARFSVSRARARPRCNSSGTA